jgi:hypothetical protein
MFIVNNTNVAVPTLKTHMSSFECLSVNNRSACYAKRYTTSITQRAYECVNPFITRFMRRITSVMHTTGNCEGHRKVR